MIFLLRKSIVFLPLLILMDLSLNKLINADANTYLDIIISSLYGWTLLFFLPFNILSGMVTYKLLPIRRAIVSLFIQIFLSGGMIFFVGLLKLAREVDFPPDELIPRTLIMLGIATIPILLYWLLDELMRWILREPSAVIQRKAKNYGRKIKDRKGSETMSKKITYILLIISIVAIGCVPFQKETPVTIQVVDKSNKPLSEITVEIIQSADTVVPYEGVTIHTRRTDKNGQVSVGLPQGKEYEILVQAVRKIITVSNEPITLKVQLEKVYPEVLPGL